MEEDFSLAKKPKLQKEEDEDIPLHHTHKQPVMKCTDFLVSRLEDFYKPNPPFRLPVEIGSFSFDSSGIMVLNRSGLRYFSQPPRLGFDLKIGYDSFECKLNQTPDLTDILKWISYNWSCFQTKQSNSQSSFEGKSAENGSGFLLPAATTGPSTAAEPTTIK